MEASMNSNSVKCITSRFYLPLFMVSRNRVKYTRLSELAKYIKKMNHVYIKGTDEGTRESSHTLEIRQDIGVRAKRRPQRYQNSWQLPPNLYDTNKIPYEKRKGIAGAYWRKEATSQAELLPNYRQHHDSFLSLPIASGKTFTRCHRHKGVFITNARERRATARCMICDLSTCNRNPSDPGPATYNPIHERTARITSANLKTPNPHLFYRSSIVPVKTNSVHIPHTSFTAAPGRYETRYSNTCPCSSNLVYKPTIDLLIDNEKRKKFRRLPYERIRARKYTSPDWQHVKGRGYRYLFKDAKTSNHKPTTIDSAVKAIKNIPLYPDAKYIGIINNPSRTPLSVRLNPVLDLIPRIKFNCIAKKVARKQLKNNKKIAFNSGQERFPDNYRLPVLTQKQQEELKQTLPPERQLRDHPVMNKPLSEVKSKLHQTPKHMMPNYVPKLRKKIFKFEPLPQPKVLVTENDTNVKETNKDGYYFTLIEAKKFFKESTNF